MFRSATKTRILGVDCRYSLEPLRGKSSTIAVTLHSFYLVLLCPLFVGVSGIFYYSFLAVTQSNFDKVGKFKFC